MRVLGNFACKIFFCSSLRAKRFHEGFRARYRSICSKYLGGFCATCNINIWAILIYILVHPYAQHSLRLLQETSLGKTLAAVGPTRAGLLRLRFSKPGAHGLQLAAPPYHRTTGPGIKIHHNPENQIRHVGA